MIVFNVKADGTVETLPSIVPQASSLADIVILSAFDYAFCYLHLTPPSGVYIPDVVCTPVLTTDRQVTLWTAPMPAEATKIGGNVGYTIYFKAKDGTTQRTNPGTFPVPRTEISTVDEDGKFIKRVVTKDEDGNDVVATVAVDETNYGEIYQVIADIYQAFVSLNREQLENANLLEVLDDLLQGYNREPDENRTGAVMNSVIEVDAKTDANAKSIQELAESTEADITALQSLTPRFGTITILANEWESEKTTEVSVSIPGGTLRNGALMVIAPANDATKKIVAEQGMSMAVDKIAMSEAFDAVCFERLEGRVPEADLTFRYAVIYADVDDAPAVTLVGGLGGGGNGGEEFYVGEDEPPATATVWIDPSGDPTNTETWEFVMENGDTVTKELVVVDD